MSTYFDKLQVPWKSLKKVPFMHNFVSFSAQYERADEEKQACCAIRF